MLEIKTTIRADVLVAGGGGAACTAAVAAARRGPTPSSYRRERWETAATPS